MSAKKHRKRESWTDIVIKALKSLGAEQKAVLIQEIYDAVKKITPSMCDDRNIYTYERGNVGRSEPKWKKLKECFVYTQATGASNAFTYWAMEACWHLVLARDPC
jgi:hypothetical protein